MKVFFDTNVYVAEALSGDAAQRMLAATVKAAWRISISPYVLDEIEQVMSVQLRFSRRFAFLTRQRAKRRATLVEPGPSRHQVPGDPGDSPILQAAIAASVDILVTNDAVLLGLSPYEGLEILSMSSYYRLLLDRRLLA
ncbi:MAG TPA: putative toxin-antitoxin system toxin component, PIN family [Thermoanaerobaculia bacterium]|nr:putative toxin-antitoxin system toxin component, PIN family [Thermoanaerobaculia bacterium]